MRKALKQPKLFALAIAFIVIAGIAAAYIFYYSPSDTKAKQIQAVLDAQQYERDHKATCVQDSSSIPLLAIHKATGAQYKFICNQLPPGWDFANMLRQ